MNARISLLIVPLLLLAGVGGSFAAEPEPPRPAVLTLQNGEFVRGNLSSIKDGRLTWNSEFFTQPLEFPLASVTGIRVQPEKDVESKEDFVIEFANSRDRLLGKLVSIDKETIEIESADFGAMILRRDAIRRISRNGEDNQLYPVPTRLEDWKQSVDDSWQSSGQAILTSVLGSQIYADVKLPAKAVVEFELAWTGTPKFGIYFGTTSDEESLKTAYSIEVWGNNIVAQGRSKDIADVATIKNVKSAATSKSNSIHLMTYLDRDLGQMIVTDSSGRELGKIKTQASVESDGAHSTGITIVNGKRLELKQLRVRGWSGGNPRSASAELVSVEVDDKEHGGKDVRAADGKLQLKTKDDEVQRFDYDDIRSISFKTPKAPTEQRKTVLSWKNGNRVSGDVVAANETEVTVNSSVFAKPIALPLTGLKGLWYPTNAGAMSDNNSSEKTAGRSYAEWYAERRSKIKTKPTTTKPLFKHRKGTLELMDTRLTGWLVSDQSKTESKNESSSSCLVWQPEAALNSSALRTNTYGRIVYAKPTITATKRSTSRPNAVGFFGFGGIAVQANTRSSTRKTSSNSKTLAGTAVHLRSGDTIPCKVVSIDQRGVHIESDLTETKSLPHSQVKAAQLTKTVRMPILETKKRERLLTLPRMHREIPPQHLLFSKKGDVLRGSVVTMGDAQFNLEVRQEEQKVPRDRISAIVWLHENELAEDGDKEPPKEAAIAKETGSVVEDEDENEDDEAATAASDLMVQVIGKTDSRFTFAAKRFTNDTVFGTSEILKDVHAKVDQMNQLLLGGFIQRSARSLPYHRWRLTDARDPAFVTAGDEESQETIAGTESGLVGTTAPDIKLVFLDGKKFNLSDYRGQTVVLDFWASWCGPCLQAMPVIDEVVSEFDESKVRLFAVNLEETGEQVKATLERRQLDVTVVLDRDGVAAGRYEANAIPQTVVIAPDGKITRVFVGGGKKLGDQLRTAITETTSDDE